MSRRAQAIVSAATIIAVVMFTFSVPLRVMGHVAESVHLVAVACFVMLWAIYLEVYSHHG